MNNEEWNNRLNELEALIKKTGKKPLRRKNQQLYSFVYIYTTGIHKYSCKSKQVNEILERYGVKQGNKEVIWNNKYMELESFLKDTGKRPNYKTDKPMAQWLNGNTTGINKNTDRAKLINELLEKYGYAKTNRQMNWNDKLKELESFLKETGKRPHYKTDKVMAQWLSGNTTGTNKNTDKAKLINDLLEKYGVSKKSHQEIWNDNFKQLEYYLKERGENPTNKMDKKLYAWINADTNCSKKNADRAKLINELFKKYGINKKPRRSWEENFKELELFLNEIGKKPTSKTDKLLSQWINQNTTGINKDSDKAKFINNLLEKYGVSKKSYQEIWNDNFNQLEYYLKERGENPTYKMDKKLYAWIRADTNCSKKNADRAKLINDLFKKHGLK